MTGRYPTEHWALRPDVIADIRAWARDAPLDGEHTGVGQWASASYNQNVWALAYLDLGVLAYDVTGQAQPLDLHAHMEDLVLLDDGGMFASGCRLHTTPSAIVGQLASLNDRVDLVVDERTREGFHAHFSFVHASVSSISFLPRSLLDLVASERPAISAIHLLAMMQINHDEHVRKARADAIARAQETGTVTISRVRDPHYVVYSPTDSFSSLLGLGWRAGPLEVSADGVRNLQ